MTVFVFSRLIFMDSLAANTFNTFNPLSANVEYTPHDADVACD